MDIQFERLYLRAEVLGNHYQRYLKRIENHFDNLRSRLEQAGYFEEVHLWKTARDIENEMAIISSLGTDKNEKYEFMGCFFALQYLQLILNAYDNLFLNISRDENKDEIYKNFMLTVGAEFRALTAAYMRQLLLMDLTEEDLEHVVFLGVGTRSDQDDIDIGAVDDGIIDRKKLNLAIAKMNSQMFKNATTLHFHLSEHVGSMHSYTASIPEYDSLLNNAIHDFVIITEMLGAALVIGSRKLFVDFRRKITNRYFYSNSHDIKFHEGYLRGIIGETRSFMFRDVSDEKLIPKIDALRMIKLCLFAAKTTYGLPQVNAWKILAALKVEKQEEERRQHWANLERQLNFFEIFRYLYQMMAVQEEEINVTLKGTNQDLAKVAKAMGYRRVGSASAVDFLLTDYYDFVVQAKKTVQALLPAAIDHLQTVTSFNKTFDMENGVITIKPGNFAEKFVQSVRFFWGTRFWDDILSILEKNDATLLIQLVEDFEKYPRDKRAILLKGFLQWAENSYITMFRMINMLYNYRQRLSNPDFYAYFNDYLIKHIEKEPDQAQRISTIFNHFPQLVYNYISLLKEDQQKTFENWLDSDMWSRELETVRKRLRYLLMLRRSTSRYFQLRLDRLAATNPKLIHYIMDPYRLTAMGKGIWAEVERDAWVENRQKHLLNYMDFEFVRVGLLSISGLPAKNVAYQYSEFTTYFINMAFDLAKQLVDMELEKPIKTKDTFGVFVSGGLGQMQAFVDDFDLLLILNSSDEEMLAYCSRVASKANSLIGKSGILPHYCLSELTSTYITTFDNLREILSSATPHFIEQSQLLCAKLLYGSKILQNEFNEEILEAYIFRERLDFTRNMLTEMYDRQQHHTLADEETFGINVKEDPGGLRDTEMLLIILRALHYNIRENSNYLFMQKMMQEEPKIAADLFRLHRSYEYLRKIRNLTRLTVAADDNVTLQTLERVGQFLKSKSKEGDLPQYIYKRIKKMMQSSQKATDAIIRNHIEPLMQ